MPRLTHSDLGFVRSMQISKYKIFIFVEGKENDPVFYDRMLHNFELDRSLFKVFRAYELPGNTGGKQKILEYFKRFRKKGLLRQEIFGKSITSMFFCDKDIDDVLRKKLRSDHLIYSPKYSIENTILDNGDINLALQSSLSLDLSTLKLIFPARINYIENFSYLWKEWLKLVLFNSLNNIRDRNSYAAKSSVNFEMFGEVDTLLHTNELGNIKIRSRYSDSVFGAKFLKISKKVDKIYESRRYGEIFNGKWYVSFFHFYVQKKSATVNCSLTGFHQSFMSTMIATQNFNGEDYLYYKNAISKIIDL